MRTKFIDNTKIMLNGQITLPKEIREVLGVSGGDRVTFIVDGYDVRIANSAVYAMREFQKQMQGQTEYAQLKTDDDVVALIMDMRSK